MLHKWVPAVRNLLESRRKSRKTTRVVWLLQKNVQFRQLIGDGRRREYVEASDLVYMSKKQDIVWPGYWGVRIGGHYLLQYGCNVCVAVTP